MALYEKKAQEQQKVNERLFREFPELMQTTTIPHMVYSGLKAMPRVHGTIKKNYMRTAFGEWYKFGITMVEKDNGDGKFEALTIEPKFPLAEDNPYLRKKKEVDDTIVQFNEGAKALKAEMEAREKDTLPAPKQQPITELF